MQDARGNPVSTASSAAQAHLELALWRMVSFFDSPLKDLEAAQAEDPAWPMPALMRAGFLLSLTEPSVMADARAALAQAEQLLAHHATEREQAHLAAARSCADGHWAQACEQWDEILQRHPRDLCALQWAHLFDFYRGDAAQLQARVERVLPAWPVDDPLRPYLLGMLAFGLEEGGHPERAEAVGREATAGRAKVPWATHAVTHVMEMQGRHREGLQWLDARRADWAEGNGFAMHHWWHAGLFQLEALDTAAALALYDAQLSSGQAAITLNRLDGAALLWRLHLLGVDVGKRWADVASGWDLLPVSAGFSVFNDVHGLLALVGQGRVGDAQLWHAVAQTRPPGASGRDIGVPLMAGLLAFAQGDMAATVRMLVPLRAQLHRIGGSHAQRDLVTQTLLTACLCEAGRERRAHEIAHQLLADRQRARGLSPLTEHWLAQLPARAPSPGRVGRP